MHSPASSGKQQLAHSQHHCAAAPPSNTQTVACAHCAASSTPLLPSDSWRSARPPIQWSVCYNSAILPSYCPCAVITTAGSHSVQPSRHSSPAERQRWRSDLDVRPMHPDAHWTGQFSLYPRTACGASLQSGPPASSPRVLILLRLRYCSRFAPLVTRS